MTVYYTNNNYITVTSLKFICYYSRAYIDELIRFIIKIICQCFLTVGLANFLQAQSQLFQIGWYPMSILANKPAR